MGRWIEDEAVEGGEDGERRVLWKVRVETRG